MKHRKEFTEEYALCAVSILNQLVRTLSIAAFAGTKQSSKRTVRSTHGIKRWSIESLPAQSTSASAAVAGSKHTEDARTGRSAMTA